VPVKYKTTGVRNSYGFVCTVMFNPPELPINDEAQCVLVDADADNTGAGVHKGVPRLDGARSKKQV